MALKHTDNEVAEVFLQNENLTQKHIIAYSSNKKTYKNNYFGNKYGLSELSNDKTYLETELPARKRFKPETELYNSTKYLDKTCKAVVDDDDESTNFVNEEKYCSEKSNILSSEQGFENNPPQKELLTSNLNVEINIQSESSALKSGSYSVSQSNILDNLDNDISNCDIGFDDEVSKCCELLNLDVPRMAIVSTTATKNDNIIIENRQIYKCEMSNHSNKSLDTLYPQSTKLTLSLKTMSNDDINLGTDSFGETSKMQDELLNKKEKSCDDNIEFKDESNSVLYTIVTSNSFLTTCNENNINDKFCHSEINVGVEDNLLESEFSNNDENNSPVKRNNILNFNSTSVGEPFIFISQRIQNKSNSGHLNLTIENTLNCDTLKLKETNQNTLQDHLNDNKDEIIEISSAGDDSDDILSLCNESEIDFDETGEEISKTNSSESAPAILEGKSKNNATVFYASPDHDSKSYTNTSDEVKKEGNFIVNEKIGPVDVNRPLDDKNCCENKNNFDMKVDESFVSEYEISLLADDTDSIFSEESLDSEYEISLLEDDVNVEENQNGLNETHFDSNVGSNYSPNGTAKDDEKIASEGSLDSEYEISYLEGSINDEENQNDLHGNKSDSYFGSNCLPKGTKKDEKTTSEVSLNCQYKISLLEDEINYAKSQNDLYEDKSDFNVGSNYLLNSIEKSEKTTIIPQEHKEQENEHSTDNINLSETDKVISKNKICSKGISERKTASSNEEKIPSNCKKNNKIADKTDPDVKISPRKEEIQTFSEIKSNEDKTEQDFRPITDGKTIIRSEKSKTLRYDGIKKELSENTNDGHFRLNLEINKSDTLNNKLKKSAEKAVIVNKTKNIADSVSTSTAIIAKFGKRDVREICELKQNIQEEFQLSNVVTDGKTFIRSENSDGIKTELSENTNDSCFPLKLEINNKSRTLNKEILNNKFKNSEGKAVIVNKINHLVDSVYTSTATVAKFEKRDVHEIGKLKQNIKEEFLLSNEVVLNNKLNERKKFAEITSNNKANAEKSENTDMGVSASIDSKQDVKDIIPDYYEEEKEDLINPGWNKIKELSTDEERYRQVRDCWESKTIPNPFKNLTYYSYRKRKINCQEDNTRQTRQHKRHASSNLNDKDAKRSRSCTYIFDDRIKSFEKEKEMEVKTIQEKMFNEVSHLDALHHQEEMGIHNFYGYSFDPRRQFQLNNLRGDYQQRVSSVTAEYEQKVNNCYGQYSSKIDKLKNNRNEVLQFYSFYKGLNTNEYNDPTILTTAQMLELEEIENIYKQMDLHYR